MGLTDQWLHQRLSIEHYHTWYAKLQHDVKSKYSTQEQRQQQRNNRMPSRACIVADRDYRWEQTGRVCGKVENMQAPSACQPKKVWQHCSWFLNITHFKLSHAAAKLCWCLTAV